MTEVQESLLNLLKEIDEICRKYDIEYYLGGGTLIGAVRHGGFLPWDDDADIHMSRENADKFIAAVKKEKRAHRDISHLPFSGGYRSMLIRYENTAATVYLRGLIGSSNIKGQYVDIFINYPLPHEKTKRDKCLQDIEMYSELRMKNGVITALPTKQFYNRYRRLSIIKKIIGHKNVLRYFEKKIFDFPEDETDEWFIGSPRFSKKDTKKIYWGKPKYIPFEDINLPVAEYSEKLLCSSYGPQWFEIPDYQERGSHVFVIDLDLPYTVYEEEIDKRIDTKLFLKEEIKKKNYRFKMLQNRNIVLRNLRNMQGICAFLEIKSEVEKYGIDLHYLVEQGCEKELSRLFSPFFNKINSSSFKSFGIYIDIPDDYLYAALYFQCFNSKYGVAKKLLKKRREIVERPISPELQRLCDICDATDYLLETLYGDCDIKKAQEIVDEWIKKEPDALCFMRADLYITLTQKRDDWEILLQKCNSYLEKYSDDGELLKYKGDLLLKIGKEDDAEKCYKKALCTLKNGFCVTDIKKYFDSKVLGGMK